MQVAIIVMNDEPAISKNGVVPLFISTIYSDTLSKLYDYATTVYSKKQYTQWYDTKEGGYTFASFKEKTDSLSKILTQYGIGAGDKVAILSQSMPNWSVAFFAAAAFGRISIPILPDSSENE